MSTASFPGAKRPGRGADHPNPSKRRGHERVELYLYSPSGPSWPVIERTFTITIIIIIIIIIIFSLVTDFSSWYFSWTRGDLRR